MPACIPSSVGEHMLFVPAGILSDVLAISPAWVAHSRTTERAADNMDCSMYSGQVALLRLLGILSILTPLPSD